MSIQLALLAKGQPVSNIYSGSSMARIRLPHRSASPCFHFKRQARATTGTLHNHEDQECALTCVASNFFDNKLLLQHMPQNYSQALKLQTVAEHDIGITRWFIKHFIVSTDYLRTNTPITRFCANKIKRSLNSI